MKKLITICLVCVLTTAAWGAPVSSITINFDENGNGSWQGAVGGGALDHGMGIPLQAGQNDQYPTLYYELPGTVVEGDLVLYEPDQPTGSIVSDFLRFVNNYSPNGGYQGRVYVYSDTEAGEVSRELADTGLPYDRLDWRAGMYEQGNETGWNGLKDYAPWSYTYTDPKSGEQLTGYLPGYMMQYGEGGVTYNFTSDIPEPATIALLGLGALSLIRRKK